MTSQLKNLTFQQRFEIGQAMPGGILIGDKDRMKLWPNFYFIPIKFWQSIK
jgi:hypothetical protein